jgi:VWFA-related protein
MSLDYTRAASPASRAEEFVTRRLRQAAIGAAVLTASLTLHAQSPQQPTFRAATTYVTVDAVVTDKDDVPVTDLTAADFEVTENGRPQRIENFQFVSVPTAARNIAARRTVEPEPDVAANTPPTPTSRLFVIVIDDLHLIEQDLVRIKRTLYDLVDNFTDDDDVAIVYTSRSDLSVNFTRNSGTLVRAINGLRGALGFGMDSAGQTASSSQVDTRQQRTSYALGANAMVRNVIRAVAGSAHPRRAIFWVTAGSTIRVFDPDPFRRNPLYDDDTNQLFAEARRADVPIYMIDPRGAVLPEDAVRGGVGALSSMNGRARVVEYLRYQRDNLATIAVNTGGRAVVGAQEMTRMVREIVRENGSYYLFGFTPDPLTPDGKAHDIKVRVKRDGVIVRARQQYVAPSAARAGADDVKAINAAIGTGVNLAGLPLRLSALPMTTDGKKMRVAVTMTLTYPSPAGHDRRFADTLETRIVALDRDAKVLATMSRPRPVSGQVSEGGEATLVINDVIEIPAKDLVLRAAVVSPNLGAAGSVQTEVWMPAGERGLTMSGIAVGVTSPSREVLAVPSGLAGLVPFQPTTDRAFSTTDTLRFYGHAFWKDRKARPALTLIIDGPAGTKTVPLAVRDVTEAGKDLTVTIDVPLPLTGFTAGRYHAAVEAKFEKGSAIYRDVMFEVR